MKNLPDTGGYLGVWLIKKRFTIHTLVWDHFGDRPRNGRKLQVDHINNDKTDNRIDNLQLLTPSQHKIKDGKISSSGFTGVYKHRNKWKVMAYNNYLGLFKTKKKAHEAYKRAVATLV